MPAGASVTFTATCAVSATAIGNISNTATVAAPAGVTDPTSGNNSATDVDTVVGSQVTATKTASGTFVVGSTVTYTIILGNAGPGPQGDNPGNELTDVLPATLALISATASSGTAVASVPTNTVTWNGSIPAGGSVTITITATILPAANGASVSNQATAAFDADGNGSNESSALSNDPRQAGSNNPTVIFVADTRVIPALSPLALALLALMLAMLATLAGRRIRSRIAGHGK